MQKWSLLPLLEMLHGYEFFMKGNHEQSTS
jgi:hypothetical protein